jgi:hypothetical protein
MVGPRPAALTGLKDRRRVVLPVADGADLVAALTTRPRHQTWVIDLRTGHVVRSLATAKAGILLDA